MYEMYKNIKAKMLAMKLLISILVFLTLSCNHSRKKIGNSNLIWDVDTVITSKDSMFTDAYDRSYIKKYSAAGDLIYTGVYSNDKLNGEIEFHKKNTSFYVLGNMKENIPYGLWLFFDDQKVDSAKMIFNRLVETLDPNLFRYDSVMLFGGGEEFSIKKPIKWNIIMDGNKPIGFIKNGSDDSSTFLNSVILNVDEFPYDSIDKNFASKYLLTEIKKTYNSLKLIDEGTYPNKYFGNFYLAEFEAYNKGIRYFINIGIVIKKNRLYTLLGTIKYDNKSDYYLYSWLIKNLYSSLRIKA